LPAITLGANDEKRIREATLKIAEGVGVRGLINIQFALAGDILYVLEANPRASRTVPFVSKATGVALAKAAALISVGKTIGELRISGHLPLMDTGLIPQGGIAVKEAVLPWNRFRKPDGSGVESLLGPEMKSTGEVMGIDKTFGAAYAKSQIAAFGPLPTAGAIFISVADRDKRAMVVPASRLIDLGFALVATQGTLEVLAKHGIPARLVPKESEGRSEESISALIARGEISLVVNTPVGSGPRRDGWRIRTAAITRGVPCITTIQGFVAAVQGIESRRRGGGVVQSLQEWLRPVVK
jgi:carbamoyl-phosphate synthase large subunit